MSTSDALTVVLVDDSEDIRSLVRTRLRLTGSFSVVGEGGTGRDAVDLAAAHRPELMLLDISMPDMDAPMSELIDRPVRSPSAAALPGSPARQRRWAMAGAPKV